MRGDARDLPVAPAPTCMVLDPRHDCQGPRRSAQIPLATPAETRKLERRPCREGAYSHGMEYRIGMTDYLLAALAVVAAAATTAFIAPVLWNLVLNPSDPRFLAFLVGTVLIVASHDGLSWAPGVGLRGEHRSAKSVR